MNMSEHVPTFEFARALNKDHFQMSETEASKNESKEQNNEEEKPKDEEEKKEEVNDDETPKKKRKSTRFEAQFLLDPEKGIQSLYQKIQKFNPDKYPTKNEAFHSMMRIYQRWAFRLYPGEFSDTCWKIANTSGTKTLVRNFIYESNGGEPLIYDEDHPEGFRYFQKNEDSDGEYKPENDDKQDNESVPPPTETEKDNDTQSSKIDFISDDDDDQNESQTIPEILDLFASQRQ